MSENEQKKIKYIVDKRSDEVNIENIKIISPSDIENYNIDVFIISSYKYSIQFEFELYNLNKKYEIFNLYEYFALNELVFTKAYYEMPCNYEMIFINRKRYEQATSNRTKQIYLRRLIINYIYIRDFINANNYIDEYVNSNYENANELLSFKNELQKLLDDIKNILQKRQCKDLILNWIDCLSYEKLESMKYLYSISRKGIYFENSFNVMPWTTAVLNTILMGGYVIDDQLYGINKISSENSCLLKYLKDCNYDFKYLGFKSGRFKKENTSLMDYGSAKSCSTSLQWEAINILLNTINPCVIIIHNLYETHGPYGSGNLDKMPCNIYEKYNNKTYENMEEALNQQIMESMKYFDNQLKWYDSFRHQECINVYFSDHGNVNINKTDSGDILGSYLDSRIHTILFINNIKLQPTIIKELFSFINFPKLIQFLIENNMDFSTILSEFVMIQSLDAYSKDFVDMNVEKNIEYIQETILQRRGVRTSTDKYTKTITGHEKYFILPDETTNYINDKRYQDKINELRQLAGNKFIDIYKDDYFIESRRLYEKFNISIPDDIEYI